STLSATDSTVPSGARPSGWEALMGEDNPCPDPPATVAPIQPPSPPETSMAATIPAASRPRPDLRGPDCAPGSTPGPPPGWSGGPEGGAVSAGRHGPVRGPCGGDCAANSVVGPPAPPHP